MGHLTSKVSKKQDKNDTQHLDALVAVLKSLEENQRKLIEQQETMLQEQRMANDFRKFANEQRTALSEQGRAITRTLEELVKEERRVAGSAIRNEFRACKVWNSMPTLDGNPPDALGIEFPAEHELQSWAEGDKLTRLATAYGIKSDDPAHQKLMLKRFIKGQT
ncbi:hypothetical protein K474DRAFT_1384624 [Panus rudis PR-1116 ss-1]|nr:hypothetical protein K474DRAFT_1384624 [Panus rudis PR-1116 ss-1]